MILLNRIVLFFMLILPVFVFGESVLSSSGEYRVTGFEAPGHVVMADWADDITDRLEETLGLQVQFRAGPLRILAVSRPDISPRVRPSQGWLEGFLQQKLYVVNPENADQEDFVASLTWLLMNRLAISMQDPGQRRSYLAKTPPWLAIGLSQDLYTALRRRNSRAVVQDLREGIVPSVVEVLSWQELGPPLSRRRCTAGLLVGLLNHRLEKSTGWEPVFKALAKGTRLDLAWLQEHIFTGMKLGMIEVAWQDWIKDQAAVIREAGGLRYQDIEQIEGVIIRPLAEHLPGKGELVLDRLVYADRSVPSFHIHLEQARQHLFTESLGRNSELDPILDAYRAFLDTLLEDTGMAAQEHQLQKLEAAREKARRLVQKVRVRKVFLDELQARSEVAYLEPVGREGMDWRMGRPWRATIYLDDIEPQLVRE